MRKSLPKSRLGIHEIALDMHSGGEEKRQHYYTLCRLRDTLRRGILNRRISQFEKRPFDYGVESASPDFFREMPQVGIGFRSAAAVSDELKSGSHSRSSWQ
jgi:hypothetical protein